MFDPKKQKTNMNSVTCIKWYAILWTDLQTQTDIWAHLCPQSCSTGSKEKEKSKQPTKQTINCYLVVPINLRSNTYMCLHDKMTG